MHTRLVMLGALLAPALALAQPADPTTPPPLPPDPVVVEPAPPAPAPTVIVNPPPPPPPAPVVRVNPTVTVTPQPEYVEVYDSYNAAIFTSGALVFGATYGASVIVAASSEDDRRSNRRLYVPLVGPWLALAERGDDCDLLDARCDDETTAKVLLVADGIFQAAGVIAMIDGVLQPTKRRVVRSADTKVRVRPTVVHASQSSGPGIGVSGKF